MITAIAAWLVKRSLASGGGLTLPHAERIVTRVLVVLGAAILLALAILWIRADAVDDYKADRLEDTVEATRNATENDAARSAAREEDSRNTLDDLEAIHAEDPEAAAAPASRGTRRVVERLQP